MDEDHIQLASKTAFIYRIEFSTNGAKHRTLEDALKKPELKATHRHVSIPLFYAQSNP
jgi:hypothetical protein